MIVRALCVEDVDVFVEHLAAHLAENGTEGTPLFSPTGASEPFNPERRRTDLLEAMSRAVGREEWLRAWGAFSDDGALVGHLDLRARPEPSTAHRAVLGLGVLRPFRGRGVGRRLIANAVEWARTQPLSWIDLYVFESNTAAQKLYADLGFEQTGLVRDLFRVGGASIDDVAMTLRL